MNDLDLGLEVVSRSHQPLRHIRQTPLNISETVRDVEAWFQRTMHR